MPSARMVVSRAARSSTGRPLRWWVKQSEKPGPAVHLQQQVGDPGTGQHAVGALGGPQRLGRRLGL